MSWERYGVARRVRGSATAPELLGAATFGSSAAWLLTGSRSVVALAIGAAGLVLVVTGRRRRAQPPGGADPGHGVREAPRTLTVVHGLLTVAWLVGLVVVAAATIAGLVGPRTFFEGPDDGLTIGVRFEHPAGIATAGQGADGEFRTGLTDGSVTIADPGRRALLSTLAGGGLALLAGLVVVHQLRGVVRSAVEGDPFAEPNARRLRVVGAVTIATGLGWAPVSAWVVAQTVERVEHGGPPIAGPPATTMLVLVVPGVVLLALAEVFRWGHGLRDDQALTI